MISRDMSSSEKMTDWGFAYGKCHHCLQIRLNALYNSSHHVVLLILLYVVCHAARMTVNILITFLGKDFSLIIAL